MNAIGNSIDSLISQAAQENPFLGGLLGVLLDGGRIVCASPTAENILNMFPGLLYFESRSVSDGADLSALSERDLLILENLTVDQLWKMSHLCRAQLALLTPRATDPTLVDYQFPEPEFRSALMSLQTLWDKITPHRQELFLDGVRDQAGLFLDRDGVLVKDVEYLHDPSQVELGPAVVETLKLARSKGFRLFVVTNQSGLGRGMYTAQQYDQVTARMQELLAAESVYLDRVVKAPFYEKSPRAAGLVRKGLRKPRPGMIHSVVSEFRIDLSKSVMVGDCATDLMAGALAGIPNLYLLKSHRTNEEMKKWREWPLVSRIPHPERDVQISSLLEIFK